MPESPISPEHILGVSKHASVAEIQAAYEEKIAYWTDIQSSVPARESEAKAMQQQIFQAYASLLDQARDTAAGLEAGERVLGRSGQAGMKHSDKEGCPRCGAEDNSPGSRYCHCGARLFQICPNPGCKAELPWHAERCNRCGVPIEETLERLQNGESVIRTCPKCRSQVSWHEETCPHCRIDIVEELARQAAEEERRRREIALEATRSAQAEQQIREFVTNNWPWSLRRHLKQLPKEERRALVLETKKYRSTHHISKPLLWRGWFFFLLVMIGGFTGGMAWGIAGFLGVVDPEVSGGMRGLAVVALVWGVGFAIIGLLALVQWLFAG